jgi:hypothetical protein
MQALIYGQSLGRNYLDRLQLHLLPVSIRFAFSAALSVNPMFMKKITLTVGAIAN